MRTLQNTNAWLPAIFEDLLQDNRLDVPSGKTVANKVNILESENEFSIQMIAPGFSKKSFTIEVEKNTLEVSGTIETKETSKENTPKFTRKEFMVKNFTRSFTLPETIDVEAIKATYKNGILTVILPKMEEVISKKKMVEIS